MISFEYPYLILLIMLPFVVRYIFPPVKGLYGDALKVPFINDLKNIKIADFKKNNKIEILSFSNIRWWSLFVLWFLLVIALMRPVSMGEPIRIEGKSRDILLVTDISTSMLEDDFSFQGRRLSRLGAVRAVVSDFVNRRISDRLGLILFGTRAYLQSPLTYDRNSVQEILWSMQAGMAGNTTAIGDALGLAVKTLTENDNKYENKVIVLLTDGENNDGSLSLPQAILMAKNEKIKVYTVGVSGGGFAAFANMFFANSVSSLDEESLKRLADETKGRYFKADSLQSLADVYKAIDVLEPIDIEQNYIYPKNELYYIPLLLAILLASVLMYAYRRS